MYFRTENNREGFLINGRNGFQARMALPLAGLGLRATAAEGGAGGTWLVAVEHPPGSWPSPGVALVRTGMDVCCGVLAEHGGCARSKTFSSSERVPCRSGGA